LALFGSPRKGGNTDILLEEFLHGCTEAGAEVDRIRVAILNVSGCVGCNGCAETGRCVIKDDMRVVHEALNRSDHVVFASPIYFYNVTAQAKAVIDRSQALWSAKYLMKGGSGEQGEPPARKGFFIAVGATRGKRMFEGARLTMQYFFDAIDAEYAGELFYWGIDEKGSIKNHPTALKECYQAGLRFVSP